MTPEAPPPAPKRPDDFPFAEWQLGIEDASTRLTGRVRHCAGNAFLHLRKAWRLHGVDDEMSAFHAITAEEEAATALIQALKARRYAGADRLRPWNHVHKSAFWPLVEAVNRVLVASGMPAPKVALSRFGKPRVSIRIDVAAMAGSPEPLWGEPDHPLNFLIRAGAASAPLVHLFEEQFAELASESGTGSLKARIEREANARNELLYASDQGCPRASFDDDMLMNRANRVCVLVMLAIIVMQTPEHQLFVTQCLESLLRMLASVEGIDFDYSSAAVPVERQLLTICRAPGEPARISLRRPVAVTGRWGDGGYVPKQPLRPTSASVGFDDRPPADAGQEND
ncbi:hypothetical protein LK533_10855 [Sphingomonas sp. PL-96]|nr:hypothetical protein [Sphingomonas sp. PL-96]